MADIASNSTAIELNRITDTESRVEIKDLVQLMVDDRHLIDNWTQLCDGLRLHTQDIAGWERRINCSNLKPYVLFSEMLNSWVTLTGNRSSNSKTVQDLCNILRKDVNCTSVAETLEDEFGSPTLISPRIPHKNGVNFRRKTDQKRKSLQTLGQEPAKNFTGRKKVLRKMKNYFHNSKKDNVILICGFGGVGKTELCKTFATNIYNYNLNNKWYNKLICMQIYKSNSAIWLNGETFETLRDSVLQLATRELGLTDEVDATPSEYFEHLTSLILENCSRLLILIDNVDVSYEEVIKVIRFITLNKKRMFVVVTSRNRNVLEGAGITIQLDVLSKYDAQKILKSSMDCVTDSEANELCELVQYFPLALQQAVAYIKQQRTNFRTPNYNVLNYVEDFESESKRPKMLGQKLNGIDFGYSMTTSITWDMTIRKMSKSAVEILNIVSHLEGNGIEVGFLQRICERVEDSLDFDEGLNLLHNYSLLKIENEVVSVHRLVQEVMRGKIQNHDVYCRKLFESVLFACGKFGQGGSSGSELVHLNSVCRFGKGFQKEYIWHFYQVLHILFDWDMVECALEIIKIHYPHIHCNNLNESGKKEWIAKLILWGMFNNDLYDFLSIETILNDDYFVIRDTKNLELGLEISVKYFGATSGATFAIKNELVKKLVSENKIDKAITEFEEMINFPFSDEQKSYCFETLKLLSESGASNESQLEKILNLIINYGGIYPTEKLKIMVEANIFHIKGDYKKSLELYLQLCKLEKDKKNISFLRAKVAEQKIKLADFDIITEEEIDREFGYAKYQELSLETLEKILPVYKSTLGPSHTLTVEVKNAVAGHLLLNNKERCIRLCEEILDSPIDEAYEKAFNTFCRAKNIGYTQQKKMLKKFFNFKRHYNQKNNMVRVMLILAKTKEKFGKLEKALQLFVQVRDSAIECEWNENDLKTSRVNVMRLKLHLEQFSGVETRDDIYKEFGEFENYKQFSIEKLQRMLAFYKGILGEKDKLTLRVTYGMARKLYYLRYYRESLSLVEQVISSSDEDGLVERAYDLVELIGGKVFFSEHDYDKSKELLEKVFEFRVRSLGENHDDTIETKKMLAKVLESAGDFHRAKKLRKEIQKSIIF